MQSIHGSKKFSRNGALLVLAIAFALCAAAAVHAGGGINEPHEHTEEDGPTYFGFVRDQRNTPVNDAKITLKIKPIMN